MVAPSLGSQIRDARKLAKMTQADVAEKLSLSVQAVSQWETDKTIPTFKNLIDLKKLIGLVVDDGTSDFLMHRHVSWDEPEVAVRAPIVPWENPGQWRNLDIFEHTREFVADDFLEVRWRPVGEVYALVVKDNTLRPDFARGDHIIIDTGRAAEKGDVVVAAIENTGRITWGKYVPLGVDEHRAPIFELAHHIDSIHGIPFKRFDTENPGRVIGVVREQRRYFRRD